jgi:hypothetical protein
MINPITNFPLYSFTSDKQDVDKVRKQLEKKNEEFNTENVKKSLVVLYKKEKYIGLFAKLPFETIREIFSFLDANTALGLVLVNKKMCWLVTNCHLLNPRSIINKKDRIFNVAVSISNDAGVVRMLHNPMLNLNVTDMGPVFASICRHNNIESVKVLLKHKFFDPVTHGKEGFKEACQKGHAKIVEILLADGRIDPCLNWTLYKAVQFARFEVLKLLYARLKAQVVPKGKEGIDDKHMGIEYRLMPGTLLTDLNKVNIDELSNIIKFLMEKFYQRKVKTKYDIVDSIRDSLTQRCRDSNKDQIRNILKIKSITSIPGILDDGLLEACKGAQNTIIIKSILECHEVCLSFKKENLLEEAFSSSSYLNPSVAQLLLDDERIYYNPLYNNMELLRKASDAMYWSDELLNTIVSHKRVAPHLGKILERAQKLKFENLVEFLSQYMKGEK